MLKQCFLAAATLAALAGCATPHVVQPSKITDSALSCNLLNSEMAEADRFRADAVKEKGVTGTNVAAVVFFWPAMIGTYSNANDAIAAADARKTNLMAIYKEKRCQDGDFTSTVGGGGGGGGGGGSMERKLNELKSMFDKKLISRGEYETQRKKILAGG